MASLPQCLAVETYVRGCGRTSDRKAAPDVPAQEPWNFMFDAFGRVKLIDLGMSVLTVRLPRQRLHVCTCPTSVAGLVGTSLCILCLPHIHASQDHIVRVSVSRGLKLRLCRASQCALLAPRRERVRAALGYALVDSSPGLA